MTAEGLPSVENEVREAWIAWLTARFSGLPMLQFTTLTFAPTPYEQARSLTPSFSRVKRAALDFEKFLIFSQGVASYFAVLEVGKWNGRRHLHLLISSWDASLMRAALGYHEWRSGFSKTIPLEAVGGIPGYVSKYVMKSHDPFWLAGGPAFGRGAFPVDSVDAVGSGDVQLAGVGARMLGGE